MCYRCGFCTKTVTPRTPMRRYIQYKRDPIMGNVQIAKETPICSECQLRIGCGEKPGSLVKRRPVAFMPPKARPSSVVKAADVTVSGVNRFKKSPDFHEHKQLNGKQPRKNSS